MCVWAILNALVLFVMSAYAAISVVVLFVHLLAGGGGDDLWTGLLAIGGVSAVVITGSASLVGQLWVMLLQTTGSSRAKRRAYVLALIGTLNTAPAWVFLYAWLSNIP